MQLYISYFLFVEVSESVAKRSATIFERTRSLSGNTWFKSTQKALAETHVFNICKTFTGLLTYLLVVF